MQSAPNEKLVASIGHKMMFPLSRNKESNTHKGGRHVIDELAQNAINDMQD